MLHLHLHPNALQPPDPLRVRQERVFSGVGGIEVVRYYTRVYLLQRHFAVQFQAPLAGVARACHASAAMRLERPVDRDVVRRGSRDLAS